ncbi:MAG: MarR family winged helix-turn-helix transcriptional regulator [Stackebrandtia sp.]
MRGLRNQLSLFHHQVSTHIKLKDVDLDCLDLLGQHGPVGPNTLAKLAGLHPATMTGIVDRLQRGGWVTRERDPQAADRRSVVLRVLPGRNRELFRLYGGMSSAMDEVCARYTESELEVITDFLRRTGSAGQRATTELMDTGER